MHPNALRAGMRLHCNCEAIATKLEPCDYSTFGYARLHCNCFAVATKL